MSTGTEQLAVAPPNLAELEWADSIVLMGGVNDLLDTELNAVTAALAISPDRIISTQEPVHYFRARDYFEDLRNVEALKAIARRGNELLRSLPEYRDAPETTNIGHEVVAALDSVVKIHGEGLHTEHEVVDEDSGQVVDGIVAADSMTFYCAEASQAQALAVRLRPLLQTADPAFSHDVRLTEPDASGHVGVRIDRPSEHTLRELGSTLAAMVAVENGVSPQEIKLSLADRKARGETFDPQEEQALLAANDRYGQVKTQLSVTHRLTERHRQPRDLRLTTNRGLLTRDIPSLQAARDIMNTLIDSLDRQENLEQHPDPKQRLASHAVVEMTRYEHQPEPGYSGTGPGKARTYRAHEKLQKRWERFRSQSTRDMAWTAGAMALKLILGGRGAALEYAFDAMKFVHTGGVIGHWRANRRAWKEHQEADALSRQKTLRVLSGLMIETA